MTARRLNQIVLLCSVIASYLVGSTTAHTQSGPVQLTPSRVLGPIQESVRVSLSGNVLTSVIRPEADLGRASGGLAADRMMLILRRSPQQDADLEHFLRDVQDPSSSSYHAFLTPDEFGRRFGPPDADIAAVRGWLASHGFAVAGINKGRTAIEFSGTVDQLQSAFHTSIHRFAAGGSEHLANTSNPQIPAALAPVIAAVSPLNDFKPRPHVARTVEAHWDARAARFVPAPETAAETPVPQLTISANGTQYLFIGPGDAATIYDTPDSMNTKLAASQTTYDGTGSTIGVVGVAPLPSGDFFYRSLFFGSISNGATAVYDGTLNNLAWGGTDDVEAALDVEVSGGLAPNARVVYYAAPDTVFQAGVLLAANRAIDDNVVDVLNVSYGECEALMGAAGNLGVLNLWQQAAAQGITVTVSSGDSGSAGCDDQNLVTSASQGFGVNGLASTPYNIAVGGTDFDALASNFSTYVGSNSANYTSALGYIPEKPWNDSTTTNGALAANVAAHDSQGHTSIWAGSGGPSTAGVNGSSGYLKPDWQKRFSPSNTDGVRDLPDVSFMAGAGYYNALWAICINSDCSSGSASTIHGVGGTSASAPAFAGMLALVRQKAGSRLGQANWVLYQLAQTAPSVFHPVTSGNISVVCSAGSPGCGSNGFMTGYNAGNGYGFAAGLGSVDVAALVNHWNDISRTNTSTTLTLDKMTFQHGQPVNITATVAPAASTGVVAIENNYASQMNASRSVSPTFVNLASGTGTQSYTQFPGGSYNVWASYPGDGAYAGSVSQPVAVTVTPEDSVLQLKVYAIDSKGNFVNASNATLPLGSFVSMNAQPVGASQSGSAQPATDATGTVQFSDALSTAGGQSTLDSSGTAEWNISTLFAGSHSMSATYGGDLSYRASNAAPVNFTISKADSTVSVTPSDTSTIQSDIIVTAHIVTTAVAANFPIYGLVTFTDTTSGKVLGTGPASNAKCPSGQTTLCASAFMSVQSTQLLSGANTIVAQYAGDTNFNGSPVSSPTTVTCNARCWNANGYTLGLAFYSLQPGGTVSAGTSITSTVSILSGGGFTGGVNLSCTITGSNPADQKIPTCSFNPPQVTITNPAASVNTVLTISSTGPKSQAVPVTRAKLLWPAGGAGLAALLCWLLPLRRTRRMFLSALLLVLFAGFSGCGGGGGSNTSSGGSGGGTTTAGTSPDTYTVTFRAVDAATGTITAEDYFKFVVQ